MVETFQPSSQVGSAPVSAGGEDILSFENITLSYATEGIPAQIIADATFRMGQGEFVSIVGPSGCGKTSLLRMVSGLNQEYGGQIRFKSEVIRGALSSVGIAFQNPVLLPWRNTLDNILLPLEVVKPHKHIFRQNHAHYVESAQELLMTVGLDGFQKRYPWQLSGGMKQRASLCRALIHKPEILLLDEPFGALDAFTREDMWELMQRLWQQTKCTTLLITHDLREAVFLSDTVYVMSPRPSEIIFKLSVHLPRPRALEICLTDDFHHQVSELRKHIRRSY
ncbi:MAG: ABC transporter ATP-binding protein [Cyanophyceae cyanobacterium]